MAIWTTPATDYDIYTILYLLKDALHSAVADARFFDHAACPKPEVRGATHAELSARLGRYREACDELKTREAIMLTKLSRARQWAMELRDHSPELAADIEQFLDATGGCDRCSATFVRDAQTMFHGGISAARFLMGRGADADPAKEAKPGDYQVGGETPVMELRVACEVFLAQIEEEFFSARPADDQLSEKPSFLTYLDAADRNIAGAPTQ